MDNETEKPEPDAARQVSPRAGTIGRPPHAHPAVEVRLQQAEARGMGFSVAEHADGTRSFHVSCACEEPCWGMIHDGQDNPAMVDWMVDQCSSFRGFADSPDTEEEA